MYLTNMYWMDTDDTESMEASLKQKNFGCSPAPKYCPQLYLHAQGSRSKYAGKIAMLEFQFVVFS